MYSTDYVYSKEHEWVSVEDETCVLGVTEFAQKELGEIVFVEMPEVGDSFEAHEEIGTVESVKAVAEIYTPVSGEVIEVNEALMDEPELVNDDPHSGGWMVKIRMSDPTELDDLMDAEAYQEFIDGGE